MDGQPQLAFPRPGRALKWVLIVVAAVAILSGIVVNLAPGGDDGVRIFQMLTVDPRVVWQQPWRLFTAALLTSPKSYSSVFFTLIGLYFLSNDLEKRWGGFRFIRFLVLSELAGFLLVLAFDALPLSQPLFHPRMMFGANAVITAAAIAWSKENANRQVRLFFVLPVSGRQLFWVTIGFCVLGVIYWQDVPEGAIAPFGGVLVGLAFSGTPSPARALVLRLRLARMRAQSGRGLTVESILDPRESERARKKAARKAGGPPLRVVMGGLDDELAKRKPPKDKRYLN